MIRIVALFLILIVSSCKAKQNVLLRQDEKKPELIQIEENGGFMGHYGPYTFSSEGLLLSKKDTIRKLKAAELKTIEEQINLIRKLPNSHASSQTITRSIRLYSPADTLHFQWGLEDEKADDYNVIYRRLSKLIIE